MGKIIGIDLGTTNSVVAIMEGSDVKVIVNPQGGRTTPSIVGFAANDERFVGQRAKNQAVTNPENTIFSIKRFMGRRKDEVAAEEKLVPYKVVSHENGVAVEVRGKRYTPPEVSAMILTFLKSYAEDHLGEKVTEAVITVPAYFNDAQRQATKAAGEIAGLNVRRIINEPTAAALAYGLGKKKEQKILVYDLGGGTFDVSVLEVAEDTVQVKSTAGDTHLGGDDYDQVLIDHLANEFAKANGGFDLRKDRLALGRLKEAAEKCKCELSSSLTANVNLPFIAQVNGQGAHLTIDVTRAQFEGLSAHLTERTRGPVEQALADAKLAAKDIDEVVLVGGSTRIPAVQELVKKIFGKEPNKSVNPDEVVAAGAAVQGAVLSGDKSDLLLLDVTPLTLGIETKGGIMTPMIPRNTTIPTVKKETFSTAERDQNAVDIKIFQGERKMAVDNRSLGLFRLDGIPAAPAGVPRIEVTFDIDANGILNVTAKDQGTGKTQSVKITNSSGIDKKDIERMKADAEKYAAEDEKRAALVELRNKADSVIFQTERMLKGITIKPETSAKIQEAVEAIKKARGGEDPEAIEKALAALSDVQHKAAEELYKGSQQGGSGADEGAKDEKKDSKEDDPIDAEFKVNE